MNKLVGKLALFHDYKHRYSCQFHLAPSLKGMYPVNLHEEAKLQLMTQYDESTCMFRNNFFDFKAENPRKRKRRSDITYVYWEFVLFPKLKLMNHAYFLILNLDW